MNTKILNYAKYLGKWIDNYAKKNKFNGIVFGLSGGIDSALLYNIIEKYTNLEMFSPFIDIESDIDDLNSAKLINQHLQVIDLTDEYHSLVNKLNLNLQGAKNNLKVRMRMCTLYAIAQNKSYLVASTSNADEYLMGYFTKFGDIAADIHPLINLTKSDIFELAKLLNINQSIINKKPSSGLSNLSDEEEMNIKYEQIDNYLLNKKNDNGSLKIISKWIKNAKHKKVLINAPKKYH